TTMFPPSRGRAIVDGPAGRTLFLGVPAVVYPSMMTLESSPPVNGPLLDRSSPFDVLFFPAARPFSFGCQTSSDAVRTHDCITPGGTRTRPPLGRAKTLTLGSIWK